MTSGEQGWQLLPFPPRKIDFKIFDAILLDVEASSDLSSAEQCRAAYRLCQGVLQLTAAIDAGFIDNVDTWLGDERLGLQVSLQTEA